MKLRKLEINFEDDRGLIRDILTNTNINHITYLTSKAGSVRGNHYHKKTTQHLYIVEGRMVVVAGKDENSLESDIMVSGEMVTHDPSEVHAYYAIEDCKILAMTEGVRGGKDYENDTYRLSKPILTENNYTEYVNSKR